MSGNRIARSFQAVAAEQATPAAPAHRPGASARGGPGPPGRAGDAARGAAAGRLREPGAAADAARTPDHRPRRRAGHRAHLRRVPRPGPARRRDRGVLGPPAVRSGRLGARRVAAGHVPAAAHPDPVARRRGVHCGPRARRARLRRRGLRQRRAAQGVRAGRGRPGWTSSHPTRTPTRSATSRFTHAHPRWIAQAFAEALGSRDEALRLALAGRRRAARPCTWWHVPAR